MQSCALRTIKGAAREHDVFEGKYLFVKLNISANVGYFPIIECPFPAKIFSDIGFHTASIQVAFFI